MPPIQIINKVLMNSEYGLKLITDYSGRGMYGDKCVGVCGSGSNAMAVISDAIKVAHLQLEDAHQFNEFVDAIMNFKTDSLGRGKIVYWEGIIVE